jgi:fibronectin-binding autotransporter adhesin
MTNSTWSIAPPLFSGDYNTPGNWSLGVPGASDIGFFGTSTVTSLSFESGTFDVGEWIFNPWASQYTIDVTGAATLRFIGAGITVNGGGIELEIGGRVHFYNNSTAGKAFIFNVDILSFHDGSTAGSSVVQNYADVSFNDDSSAGNAAITNEVNRTIDFLNSSTAGGAVIETLAGAKTIFHDFSNGGSAQLITFMNGETEFTVPSFGDIGFF